VEILITAAGDARCVYGEEIDLASLGALSIHRGSHVEPTAGGQWLCDLSPVSGPVLGPFERRSKALAAEQRWLAEHWLESRVPRSM